MTERKDLAEQETKSVREAGNSEQTMLPAMDIFEDDTGITVQADMPGVTKERLNVHIDKDALSIEGETDIDMPQGMEALYADIRRTRYQRSFSLSNELDTDKVEASFKDGVLTLRIPKREALQSRKIEVKTG